MWVVWVAMGGAGAGELYEDDGETLGYESGEGSLATFNYTMLNGVFGARIGSSGASLRHFFHLVGPSPWRLPCFDASLSLLVDAPHPWHPASSVVMFFAQVILPARRGEGGMWCSCVA